MPRMPWNAPIISDATKLGLSDVGRLSIPSTTGSRLHELLPQILSSNDFSTDFGELTEVDSGGNVAVADGVLKIKGNGAAYNVNGVYSPLVNFATPGRFRIKFTPKTIWNTLNAFIGAVATAALSIADWWSPNFYIDSSGRFSISANSAPILLRYNDFVVGTQYTFELGWTADKTIWIRLKGGVYTDWTELHRQNYNGAGTQLAFQINFYNAVATQWEFDDYERCGGYPTDGPLYTLVGDAGMEFAVSALGGYVASDDDTVVTFTGGATGILRGIVNGIANIHTISGTPQAGTVTCASTHTFTVSDAGVQVYFDQFNFSKLAAIGSWVTTNARFRYAVDGGAATGWLTFANLLLETRIATPFKRLVLDIQVDSDGATQQYVSEINGSFVIGGIFRLPAAGNIKNGVTVNTIAGNRTDAAAANVLLGSGQYGAGGTEFTPSYVNPTCTAPAGLTLADATTDGDLDFTISNVGDLEAGADLIFHNAAHTQVAAAPAAASGRIGGLTNDQSYTLHAHTRLAGYLDSTASGAKTATPTAGAGAPSTPTITSVTRVDATTARVTLAGVTAGVTGRVYFVPVAGGTLTLGGSRTGSGTVDVTVDANTEYYFVAAAYTGGYYSAPLASNVYKFQTGADAATAERWLGFPKLDAQRRLKAQTRDEELFEYTYKIGWGATLADMSLEVGDTIPGDSTMEIVAAHMKRVEGSNAEKAVVRARKIVAWAD